VKLGAAIGEVYAAEAALADGLLQVGNRHTADHDVFHLTRTLGAHALKRMEALEPHAKRYGAPLDTAAPALSPSGSLLDDVRELHLLAAEASIDWTILGQGAQAARDRELLALVGESHPEALRVLRWTTTKLKETAPQALMS
jgi:hypothetical protein